MYLKICGIRTIEEAKAIKGRKVTFVGLNFIPNEKRNVQIDVAIQIAEILKREGIRIVALFRDQELSEAKKVLHAIDFDYAQLNGHEDQRYAAALHMPIMKTIAIDNSMNSDQVLKELETVDADIYILDRLVRGEGELVDFKLFNDVSSFIPGRLTYAGGVTPDNLQHILSNIKPAGIDISSGVRINGNVSVDKVDRCLDIISNLS